MRDVAVSPVSPVYSPGPRLPRRLDRPGPAVHPDRLSRRKTFLFLVLSPALVNENVSGHIRPAAPHGVKSVSRAIRCQPRARRIPRQCATDPRIEFRAGSTKAPPCSAAPPGDAPGCAGGWAPAGRRSCRTTRRAEPPDFAARLRNRRQRRRVVARRDDVVVTDHRNVGRHVQVPLPQCIHTTERHLAAEAENSARPQPARDQFQCRHIAGSRRIVAVHDEAIVLPESRFAHGFPVALHPFAAAGRGHIAGDHGDAAVPEFEQAESRRTLSPSSNGTRWTSVRCRRPVASASSRRTRIRARAVPAYRRGVPNSRGCTRPARLP